MEIILDTLKAQLTNTMKEEFHNTLGRLRSKIFKAINVEDDLDIDLEKFTENTVKKVMSDEIFMNTKDELKKIVKTSKLKRDPDAPKPCVNSFVLFSRDNRDEVKKDNPELKCTEITKKLGKMWKESDPDLKIEYKEKSKEDRERYERELEDYEPKEGFYNPKEKKRSKKAKKNKDLPKRPLNVYMFFRKDHIEELKKQNIGKEEMMYQLKEMWENLSEKKKKIYEEKAKKDKERYDKELRTIKEIKDNKDDKEVMKVMDIKEIKKTKEEENKKPRIFIEVPITSGTPRKCMPNIVADEEEEIVIEDKKDKKKKK